jgi:hypothetical protein
MGHNRLARLPATRFLPEIVRYLVVGGTPTADLVVGITEFGRDALDQAKADAVFVEAVWLLIRLPQAAASDKFADALYDLGVGGSPPASVADVLVVFDDALEQIQHRSASSTDLGELARRAGGAALAEALNDSLPMWSPSPLDVQAALASLKDTRKFADLAQDFYSRFVEKVIHYFIDRNLPDLVGPERVARSVNDLLAYNVSLRCHCDEAAVIMRNFARDWLGKNVFHEGKEITRDHARRFSAYAVQKINSELQRRKEVS